jgi:hypothetical protein
MTEAWIIEIMERAAAALGHPCRFASAGAGNIEIRSDGWCYVGWLTDEQTQQAYDVWWLVDRGDGRLVAWQQVNGQRHPRPFPLQERTPP